MLLFSTCLNLLQLNVYGMKADIAPESNVAVAVKDTTLTFTIFSHQLTCK